MVFMSPYSWSPGGVSRRMVSRGKGYGVGKGRGKTRGMFCCGMPKALAEKHPVLSGIFSMLGWGHLSERKTLLSSLAPHLLLLLLGIILGA
jgi:hypothetical protein